MAPLPAALDKDTCMIGKPLTLVRETPTQRQFKKKAAAQYLDISTRTLLRRTRSGEIKCYPEGNQRVWLLEDLDRYIEAKGEWKAKKSPRATPAERT
jgi:hypothetical protein